MEANLSINSLQGLLDLNTSQFSSAEIELKRKLLEWANISSSMQLKMIMKKLHQLYQSAPAKDGCFFAAREDFFC